MTTYSVQLTVLNVDTGKSEIFKPAIIDSSTSWDAQNIIRNTTLLAANERIIRTHTQKVS